MSTLIYPMRLKRDEGALFKSAARKRGLTLAEFFRQAARKEARQVDAEPASLTLSRGGFILPELPGRTEREKIRAAIARRHHVSR
jgi:uncharacterized protein (DUF1778 family)